jgi:hypothetical protein
MSHSINPTDPRIAIVQFPILSDDSETVKQQAVPTPTVPVKVVAPAGSGGVTQKRVSK